MSYVVYDSSSQDAIVIDPVLDYNSSASEVFTDSVDRITHFIEANALNLRMILETHAHADHLSGAQILKERYPQAVTGVGQGITMVQEPSRKSTPADFKTDGSQFDRLLSDGEKVVAGTPGVSSDFHSRSYAGLHHFPI